jgi:hypothetical protein
MGLWFFDFGVAGGKQHRELKDNGSNGWWDFPFILDDIKILKSTLEKHRAKNEYKSDADVLMVYDTKVYYHLSTNTKNTPVSNIAVNWNGLAAWKSGVGFDAIYLDDLPRVNLDQYKVIIFNNTFAINQLQKRYIEEKVKKGNRDIIWFYAPGYSNGIELNTRNISSLTDMKIEKLNLKGTAEVKVVGLGHGSISYRVGDDKVMPLFSVIDDKVKSYGHFVSTNNTAIAKKNLKEYTSWYVALPSYDSNLLKGLLHQTSAHFYTDTEDIIYVGDGLLGIHSTQGGNRTIRLKSGKQISISLPFGSSTTILDSETGNLLHQ